jgi:hypothetical protein
MSDPIPYPGRANLFKKLAEVTEALQRVPKRGRNDFHKYDYVLEADLMEAVRLELAKRRVFIFSAVDSVQRTETLTTIHCTFTFADGESGEVYAIAGAGTGDDRGDKGLYKAITGAVKYMLMKNFLISTGDDPEGDDGPDRRNSKPRTASKPVEESKITLVPDNSPQSVKDFFALQSKLAASAGLGPKHYAKVATNPGNKLLPAGKLAPSLKDIAGFTKEGNLQWLDKLNALLSTDLAKMLEKGEKKAPAAISSDDL